MKKIKILILFFLIFTSCKSQEIEGAVDELLQSTQKINNPDLYRKFLVYGRDAIPVLIKKMDVNQKTYSGYFYPRNSNLMSLVNYDGVYAAYMIEFILSREKLDETKIQDPTWYVLFNRDVIIRPKEMRPLEFKDMLAIQRIYTAWWEVNKGRPIEELRTEWKNKNRPLLNSVYTWY